MTRVQLQRTLILGASTHRIPFISVFHAGQDIMGGCVGRIQRQSLQGSLLCFEETLRGGSESIDTAVGLSEAGWTTRFTVTE